MKPNLGRRDEAGGCGREGVKEEEATAAWQVLVVLSFFSLNFTSKC